MGYIVIDGNYLLHRCARVMESADLRSSSGKPTGGVMAFLNSLRGLVVRFRPDKSFVVFDGGISKRRRSIYPEYKNKSYRDPEDPRYVDPSPEEKSFRADFRRQRLYLSKLLEHLGVSVLRFEGWEGDDITYFTASMLKLLDLPVRIVSDDKDFYQVVSDRTGIRLWRPMARVDLRESNFEEIVGHSMDQHMFYHCVVAGDDNIKGVSGVGPGTLRQLFEGYRGPVEYPYREVLEFCVGHSSKRVAILATEESVSTILRNYQLISFECIVGNPVEEEGIDPVPKQITPVDVRNAYDFVRALEINSILKDFHNWVLPFTRVG